MSFYNTEDGYKLYYEEHGDISKPALVMLHGLGGRTEWFCHQTEYFKEKYHVIVYDQRGHGRSERKNQNLTITQMAKDLHDLTEYLKLDKIILLGWSMGVNVALSYIHQFGDHKLSRLILVDNTPNMISSESWNYGIYPDAMTALTDISQLMTIGWASYALSSIPLFLGAENSVSKEDRAWFDEIYPDNDTLAMTGIFASNLTTDLSLTLKEIHVPTLMTYGTYMSLCSKEVMEGLASYVEHVDIAAFEGGHFHFWQDAERFNKRVSEFILSGC